MSWRYRRRLSLTDRVMILPYAGYSLRISADGTLLSEIDNKLEELLRTAPGLWVYNPPPPVSTLNTSKEVDSLPPDIETEQEETIKPKRRRRAANKRAK